MFKHNLLKKKKFNAIEGAKMADELRERNSSSHFFLKVALFEFIPRAKRISFWSRGYDFKIRFASQFQRLF